eukprot:3855701-Amphidinium_carterae.1
MCLRQLVVMLLAPSTVGWRQSERSQCLALGLPDAHKPDPSSTSLNDSALIQLVKEVLQLVRVCDAAHIRCCKYLFGCALHDPPGTHFEADCSRAQR